MNPEDVLWDQSTSMAEAYDRWLVPVLFRPYATELARRAGALSPGRVLEIAAGTGCLTAELVAGGAEVTATDLSSAMVAVGAARAPGATWLQADALALPFPDAAFDLVACQFGVMFLPDKVAAFREAGRVLGPGGRLLFATWDTVEENGFAAALTAALERALPGDPPDFLTEVPHGYADPAAHEADLAAAGLRIVRSERVVVDGGAESAAAVARGFCLGTPVLAWIEARGDLAETVEAVSEDMAAALGAGPVRAQLAAYVVEAAPATA